MRILIFVSICLFTVAVFGCSNSSDPVAPTNLASGADLMGLRTNHTLRYVIYDSTSIYFPYYSIEVDTSETQMRITGGAGGTVELAFDNIPQALLTIDNIGVLLSGQIIPNANPPDTNYFYPTPVLIPQSYTVGTIQASTSPPFAIDSAEKKLTMFFLNYGYYTERIFMGLEDIVLPISSYNAYHFQSDIFIDDNAATPLMTAHEYYAPGVGLVKMELQAAGTRRIIVLLEDN